MEKANDQKEKTLETMNQLVPSILDYVETTINNTDKPIDLEFLRQVICEEIERTESIIGEEYLRKGEPLTYSDALQSMRLVICHLNYWIRREGLAGFCNKKHHNAL